MATQIVITVHKIRQTPRIFFLHYGWGHGFFDQEVATPILESHKNAPKTFFYLLEKFSKL